VFPALILGIALLAGLLLAGRWYATADTKTLLKALKWVLLGIVVSVALFFVVTGRLAWAIATLPALIPWFFRARSIARAAKTFARMSQAQAGGRPGEQTELETRFLRMSLDHGTGTMDGDVTAGPFAGRQLSGMALGELVELLKFCWVEDEESARVVETFLDRSHPDWRETAKQGQGSSRTSAMDRAEALQVLGLEEGASAAEIKDAHRRLIAGLHPDHGGSDYLAAKINQAKDLLLGD